jgi:ArsR family transcriptional regulator
MELKAAVSTLSALAHDARLAIFRLLVKVGPVGLAAGDIARRLEILPNTLSANLTLLAHTGLVTSRRDGRSIIYSANYDAMNGLITFLLEDCCGGSPEVCGPLSAIVSRASHCATSLAEPL